MNRLLFYLCVSASILLFSACKRELNSGEIIAGYSSGVVVLENRYYYKVQLTGGHTFWFVPDDDAMTDIRFYTNESEVRRKARISYGTGFFLTDDGVAVTASQVVNPVINTNDVCRSLTNQLVYLKNYYSSNLDLYKRRLVLVEDAFRTLADERLKALAYVKGNVQMMAELERDYTGRKNKLIAMQADFQHKADSLSGVLQELGHFNNSQVSVYPVQQLRMSYWQPDKQAFSAYSSCTLRASNAGNGLAVVQLVNKRTPDNCHVFELTGTSIFSGLFRKESFPSRLFIPGVRGIGGNLSKAYPFVVETSVKLLKNHQRIAYVNSVTGTNSGSPLLDSGGTLTGINLSDDAGDYGIPIEKLFQLVKIKSN